MINVKTKLLKPILVVIFSVAVAAPGMVHAIPFSTDLTINATITYDDVNSFAAGTTQGGSINSIVGGVSANSSITGASISGSNPQGGLLTDIGDGVGSSFHMSGNQYGAEGRLISDYLFDVTNNSATDQYQVTFEIELFSNMADADGFDAFVDSLISVFNNDTLDELFFSDLTSDTFFGDLDNGNDPGTFGASLSDSGLFTIDVLLNPLASFQLGGFNDLEGGVFDDFSSFNGELSSFISIADVVNLATPTPVPEPGILLLMVTGLLGFAGRRKCRRNI